MLTLFTGTPGAGKTALVVAELLQLLEKTDRPVFVMGIPGLQVPHVPAPPVEEWTRRVPVPEDPTLEEAEFTFPDGALVIVDEAQKVFRPRATGSKVPDHVAAFEKHRHKGLDFWLVSQHPNLLDAAVRKLVGRYVHLRGHWAGRELLEWPEVVEPNSVSERARAVRQRYRLPKKVFRLYQSASMHIKTKRRIPFGIYVLAVIACIVVALGYRSYSRVSEMVVGGSGAEMSAAAEGPAAADPGAVAASAPARVDPVRELTIDSFKPRLIGRPESAPLYDGVRQVVGMPAIAGCIQRGPKCVCYTEQASVADMSPEECRAWLERPPFNPFRQTLPAPSGTSSPSTVDRTDVGGPRRG